MAGRVQVAVIGVASRAGGRALVQDAGGAAIISGGGHTEGETRVLHLASLSIQPHIRKVKALIHRCDHKRSNGDRSEAYKNKTGGETII